MIVSVYIHMTYGVYDAVRGRRVCVHVFELGTAAVVLSARRQRTAGGYVRTRSVGF